MSSRLNLTIGRKLTLSFAVLGVFLVGAIAAGFSGMAKMSTAHHDVVDVAVPKQLAADTARAAASDMHFSQTAYALAGTKDARTNFEGDRATFRAALGTLGTQSRSAADKRALAAITAATAAFDRGDAQLVAAVRSGDGRASRRSSPAPRTTPATASSARSPPTSRSRCATSARRRGTSPRCCPRRAC